jgi:hypothetical protein
MANETSYAPGGSCLRMSLLKSGFVGLPNQPTRENVYSLIWIKLRAGDDAEIR